MIEWVAVWGVAQVGGAIAAPILKELAKGALEDYAKDFFKDCLGDLVEEFKPDDLKKAYGLALKEFLELIEQELEFNGFQEALIKEYKEPLKKFVQHERVAAALGLAFQEDCRSIATRDLVEVWQELDAPYLPDEFDWQQISKSYIRAVKNLIKASAELREIFSAQNLEKIAANTASLAGIQPDFNLKKYAEGIQEQYSNLRLDSLDTSGSAYNELRLWKIFVAQNVRECQEFLPQVYEIPKDRLKELRERGEIDEIELEKAELEQSRRRYVDQSPRSVLEMLAESDKKYVVILGDPGSGKSTLLQYLALDWAEKPIRELPAHPLPLLIELRLYAQDKRAGKCKDFLEFLHQGNVTCRLNQLDLDQKLRDGNVVALFDGVDEVFEPQLREEIVTDIHRFTNDYNQVRVVVTSRWLGYKAQRLRDAEFQHFMLQDLDKTQIREFINRWHDLTFSVAAADKEYKQKRLQKAIKDSRAIKELAGNPLLLTMMAILNRYQELPRDRAELYNQASRVLLHQWDIERNLIDQKLDPKTIDFSDKQTILRKVADHMQSNEDGLAGNVIGAKELKQILVSSLKEMDIADPRTIAGVILDQLRCRNFILCFLGAESYAFVHRTFLEYFCAQSFLYKFKETQELDFKNLKTLTFEKHWHDESWKEVLLLIVGSIQPKFTQELIEYLLDQQDATGKEQHLFLALDCFIEGRFKSDSHELSERLLERVKQILPTPQNQEKYDPYAHNGGVLIGQTDWIQSKALGYVEKIWSDRADILPYLKELMSLDCKSLYHEIVYLITIFSKDKKKLIHWLKVELKQRRQDHFIHESVGYYLSCYGIDDFESVQLILDLIKDEDADSMEIENEFWNALYDVPFNEKILEFLDNEALKELSSIDGDPNLQEHFLGYITYRRSEIYDVESLLRLHGKNNPDQSVRSQAIRILGRSSIQDQWLFDFLSERLVSDPFKRKSDNGTFHTTNLRKNMLEIMLGKYTDHPKLSSVLQERILNDPDEQVRDYAKKHLETLQSVVEENR